MEDKIISVVIPVYKNENSLTILIDELKKICLELNGNFEAVFVVDGSPDNSYLCLSQLLPSAGFSSQLLLLSRNFGSFSAIRAGMEAGKGEFFAVMAADMQEPPSLLISFYNVLFSKAADIVLGTRMARNDPLLSKIFSNLFWGLYRKLVQKDLPPGGVDIFACTKQVRDQLLLLKENNSSLIGLVFWIGFKRAFVPYERQERQHGKSAWTLRRKLTYLLDSFASFTDLPIKLLLYAGLLGIICSLLLSIVVLIAKLSGLIAVSGYAATIVVLTFFGGLNCLGFGIIGGYVWRSFENTKGRPLYIVNNRLFFNEKE